jgi:predicted membrane channel-forming protein YqfA (hemolysin III family)
MNPEIPKSAEPPVPVGPPPKLPIIIGSIVGAAPWLLSLIPAKNYESLRFLIFACFGMPIIATITAIVPKTRRLGLGLLLATGLGWSILGAMCSGLFR